MPRYNFYDMDVRIEASWKEALKDEFEKEYFQNLVHYLKDSKAAGKVIYPRGGDIFKAFELCPVGSTKAVILGQDPYHGPGQAMGLSFSVPEGIPAPPSLQNVFREISSDCNVTMSGRTDLTPWASQGVLLLNAILTVQASIAASHSRIGWEQFTDAVIRYISENTEGVVFMLWGNFARSKAQLIDSSRHLVLQAAHPSPLARGAFFGCRHFSKANNYLVSRGKTPIDWQL